MSDTEIYPNRDHLKPLEDAMHEAWKPSYRDGFPCVPSVYAKDIAEYIANVVAELVESYLDAGSERDAINEEIYPHILTCINGWTEEDV